MTPPATALLFQTHLFDRALARQFERLRRECPPGFECFVLMHVPPGTAKPRRLARVPHHFVSTPEIRALDYPSKNAPRDAHGRPWHLWEGGHCDLVPLHFFNAYPEFDRYWVVEYDVRFTGHWSRLFGAFENSDADFLSVALRRHADHPRWECWDSLQAPAGRGVPAEHRTRAFMPLYRASRRGMEAVDTAHRQGWGGHLEAAWPTIAAMRGMALEDIGGAGAFVRPGNRDRFYTCTLGTAAGDTMSPGSLIAHPALFRPGSRPDRIYHPVKRFKFWPEFKLVLREARAWQGARRRDLAARLRRAGNTARGRC